MKDLKEINKKLITLIIISKINIDMYNREEIEENRETYIKNLKEITKLSIEIKEG